MKIHIVIRYQRDGFIWGSIGLHFLSRQRTPESGSRTHTCLVFSLHTCGQRLSTPGKLWRITVALNQQTDAWLDWKFWLTSNWNQCKGKGQGNKKRLFFLWRLHQRVSMTHFSNSEILVSMDAKYLMDGVTCFLVKGIQYKFWENWNAHCWDLITTSNVNVTFSECRDDVKSSAAEFAMNLGQ